MIRTLPLEATTFRALVNRRRTIGLVLFAALPVVTALLGRIAGSRGDVEELLGGSVVAVCLPLIALVFGVSALGTELEDGTAIYILSKPVPRWRIVLAKAAVAGLLTIALVLPATVIAGVVGRVATGDTFAFGVAVVAGALAYTALFVALSVLTSRALIVGLAYVLVWEGIMSGLLEGTLFLSIREATTAVAVALSANPFLEESALDLQTAIIVLVGAVLGGLALASLRLASYEVKGGAD
jgi:ABC-2 type transport system permease protein